MDFLFDKKIRRIAATFLGLVLCVGIGFIAVSRTRSEPVQTAWDDHWKPADQPSRLRADQIPDYDPFTPDVRPRCWPMRPASWLSPDPKVEPSRALLTWGPTSHPLVYGLSGTQMPCLSVARGGDPGSVCIQLELTSTDGTRIAGPWLLPDGTFWVEPQVWFTDLNRDGRLDVVVLIQSDGAGLAGSEGRLIVIRSQTAGGWRADYRDAYLNSPVNFMVDPDSTSCVVMTTNIAQRKGEDGIEHSFWVHSAHVIVDQGYAPIVTGIWRDFPKCIQYTQKPNHEPTRLLSAKHLAELTSNAAATGWRLVPNLKSH